MLAVVGENWFSPFHIINICIFEPSVGFWQPWSVCTVEGIVDCNSDDQAIKIDSIHVSKVERDKALFDFSILCVA